MIYTKFQKLVLEPQVPLRARGAQGLDGLDGAVGRPSVGDLPLRHEHHLVELVEDVRGRLVDRADGGSFVLIANTLRAVETIKIAICILGKYKSVKTI